LHSYRKVTIADLAHLSVSHYHSHHFLRLILQGTLFFAAMTICNTPAANARDRRRDAIAALLKVYLRCYPEHVVAQAIRSAREVLTDHPLSFNQAIGIGKQYARGRMAATKHARSQSA
jgi:hypothetical protein